MSYDMEFIQVTLPAGVTFPIEPQDADSFVKKPAAFEDPGKIRESLLKIDGTRPGPHESIDYLGRGLNYARFFVKRDLIHVENNCSAPELLRIYEKLVALYPELLIRDLQSRQLHNADSFQQWWSRPLA